MQQLHIHIPIKMNQSIAEGHHRHHCFAKGWIEIVGFDQEAIDVAAFLRMTQQENRNDVCRDICAALDGGLERALDRQLACKVTPELCQGNWLMPL
jgi:hypothetical protein